jgi:Kef-type K+ transport system membrane component KefB
MDFTRINDLNDLQYWLIVNGVSHKIVFILGLLIVCTFLIHTLTKKLKIPSVVGYVLLGTLFSVSVLERIPLFSKGFVEWYSYLINSFNFVPTLAVSFISFTIGTSLSIKILKRLEFEFTMIVLLESIGAFVLVFLGMVAVGQPLYVALILGAIATATAPAATVMVLKEYGGEGELSATLMIVLALDEVLALIIFSFAEPISLISANPNLEFTLVNTFFLPLGKVVGAIMLGLVVGYYSQKLMATYHSKTRKVLLILATVFGVASLAVAMDMSHMIANLAVGFAYRNFAKKRLEIADRIDTLTIPLFAIYFILAGTKIEIGHITSEWFILVALVYAITRIIGKVGGASLGARLSNAPAKVSKYIGLGLLPQIGITIDLAYIIQQDFIHLSAKAMEISLLVFNIILYTTVITEIIGPLATEYALNKSGEITTS